MSVVIASCFFQYEYRLGWREEQTVSISAGQKFHLRIGLTLVSLKAERQFAVRLIQLNSLGLIRFYLLSERLRGKTGGGRGSCLHRRRKRNPGEYERDERETAPRRRSANRISCG